MAGLKVIPVKPAFDSHAARSTEAASFLNVSGGQLNIAAVVKEGRTYTIVDFSVVANNALLRAPGSARQDIGHVTFCGRPLPTVTPTSTPTDTPVTLTDTPTHTPTNTLVPLTDTTTHMPTNMLVPPTDTPTYTPTSTEIYSEETPEVGF